MQLNQAPGAHENSNSLPPPAGRASGLSPPHSILSSSSWPLHTLLFGPGVEPSRSPRGPRQHPTAGSQCPWLLEKAALPCWWNRDAQGPAGWAPLLVQTMRRESPGPRKPGQGRCLPALGRGCHGRQDMRGGCGGRRPGSIPTALAAGGAQAQLPKLQGGEGPAGRGLSIVPLGSTGGPWGTLVVV